MAVYQRAYRTYSGTLTPQWTRFWVIARYAFKNVFRSRIFLAFFVLCLLPILIWSAWIYLFHNISALKILGTNAETLRQAMPIDSTFFLRVLRIQSSFAFFLTLIIGPALVSPDLRNNALPLYLSRPFNRTDYVIGKLTVLGVLLSLITWVPALLLFLLQAFLEGWEWWGSNLRIALVLVIGSCVWIFVLSMLALAVSAWVKWKPVARMIFLGASFFLSAAGEAINQIYDVTWGRALQLPMVSETIWQGLFGIPISTGLSTAAAWTSVVGAILLSWWMLSRKLRPYEVVK